MATVRVAAAAAHFGRDLARSMERLEVVIKAGRFAGAALLALPAATLGGYPAARATSGPGAPGADGTEGSALPPDAPELRRVIALAGSMIVCVGYTELAEGRRWNSAVCVNGDGVLGHYRQVHRTPGQPGAAAVGDRLDAFDSPLGRLGLLVDYDKAFPEAARSLALDGARTIACL